jgi:hypothetical protein
VANTHRCCSVGPRPYFAHAGRGAVPGRVYIFLQVRAHGHAASRRRGACGAVSPPVYRFAPILAHVCRVHGLQLSLANPPASSSATTRKLRTSVACVLPLFCPARTGMGAERMGRPLRRLHAGRPRVRPARRCLSHSISPRAHHRTRVPAARSARGGASHGSRARHTPSPPRPRGRGAHDGRSKDKRSGQ